ncbi:carbohydrate ABC transporter permease [Roseomonas sp. CCTCC AB2023176]|uniref:carbohydrate ABC transporter permease n=1 Tax=Roseomonas sp. CCTCC AB2023176 TaxID=3342640 RepID=UPI0035DE987A
MLDLSSGKARLGFGLTFATIASFLGFPVLWMLSTAFKPGAEIFVRFPSLLPRAPTLENFRGVVGSGDLPLWLGNSLLTAGGAALLTTVLATLAAHSFARFRYRGRRALMALMISAQMFPFAVLLVSLYPMLQAAGLLDTRIGLTLSYIVFALPAGTYMLFSYFVRLPEELIEAARVDGASELRILWRIIVPVSIPGLVTVALYAFMWAWNDLLYAMTLITTPSLRTVGPGLLMSQLGEMRQDWGAAMAASLVASLPVIIAFGLVQRWFVQGLTAGAVKG